MNNTERKITVSPSVVDEDSHPRLSGGMTEVEQLIRERALFLILMSGWSMKAGQVLPGDELQRRWVVIQNFFYHLIAEMSRDVKRVFGETDGSPNAVVDEAVVEFLCQWQLNDNMDFVGFDVIEPEEFSYQNNENTDIDPMRMPFG